MLRIGLQKQTNTKIAIDFAIQPWLEKYERKRQRFHLRLLTSKGCSGCLPLFVIRVPRVPHPPVDILFPSFSLPRGSLLGLLSFSDASGLNPK